MNRINNNKLSSESFRKTYRGSQEGMYTLEINTNYGFWMNKIKDKRQMTFDPIQFTLDKWPHKKAIKSNKLKNLQQAKFENW